MKIKTNKITLLKTLFLLGIFSVALVSFSNQLAAQTTAPSDSVEFFTTLPDVPKMPGLIEQTESSIVFDKPEGRIIEMHAVKQGITNEDVIIYYGATLPQFGWGRTDKGAFFRDGEFLIINQDDENNSVKFLIKPSL